MQLQQGQATMMRVSSVATLFIRKERAIALAAAFQGRGVRIAEAVPAERVEGDRSVSRGWAVRYREPTGAWQLA